MSRLHRITCRSLGAAALLLALTSLPAAADDVSWYVAARAGDANVDTYLASELTRRVNSDADARSLGLGYRLHRNLDVELGLHDLGTFRGIARLCPDDSPNCIERLAAQEQLSLCAEPDPICFGPEILGALEAEISARSLSLIPRWPVHERLVLFARAGFIEWHGDVAITALAQSDRFSGQDLLTGAGVEVALGNGFALDVEYQQFDLDYRSTTAGVRWRF